MALANDTAGTLVAGCSKYANCHSGVILGTGTNAAYSEKVSNVSSLANCTENMVGISAIVALSSIIQHLMQSHKRNYGLRPT